MKRLRRAAGAILSALSVMAMPANAAEIRVISAEAVRDVLEGVAAQFNKDTGHTVSFAFMTAGQVRGKVDAGEQVDIAIASSGFSGELVKAGKASSSINLGRIGLAVAIREGAPPIDVATPEALVKTLLAARAVSYTDPTAGGTAGLYFASLLQKLGIADEINKRAVLSAGGRDAAEKVASGEAELGITFPSEINPVKGAKVGGLFPASLQNYVIYTAMIPATAANAEVARQYLDALMAASAKSHWEHAGFEQLSGR
jgi:molybdate transport system substrate-binding protein